MELTNKVPWSAIVYCTVILSMSTSQAFGDSPDGWNYSVAPLYLWAKNIEGSSSVGGQAAPLDLDFKDDILENLDGAFAVHFEARKGDLTLFAEYNYAKLTPSSTTTIESTTIKTSVDFGDTMWELGTAYEFTDSGSSQWEVLGGVRYMKQDLDIKFESVGNELDLLSRKISVGDDWWHIFAGVRVVTKISEKWSFRARLDIGYGESANTSVNTTAMFDYRFRDWGAFFAGYRYLATDFDNDKAGINQYGSDITQQGPVFGINLFF